MKIYKRQIKPYYEDSASYYRGYNIYELEENGEWYDEESIDVKDDKWEKLVRKKEKEFNDNEYDYDLKWKERFVPITKEDSVRRQTTFNFDDAPIGGFHDY